MTSSTKRTDASQADKFEEAARKHGADDNEKRWEERLRKIAKLKRPAQE